MLEIFNPPKLLTKMASSRGRGWGAHPRQAGDSGRQPQAQRKPKAPDDVKGLSGYLNSLNHGNLDTYGDMFADMVIGYCSNERRMQEAVNLIFETTCKDREFAPLGAKICRRIVEQPVGHQEPADKTDTRNTFRKTLLQRFQAEYKNKQSIRAVSIETWLAIFAFLYELFLRVQVQGQPIKVVGSAILSTISWLLQLEDCDDDELECVCLCLKLAGHLLEQINKDQVKNIARLLRAKAINRKSTSRVRCLVLEVLEYRAFGWKDPEGELDQFYCDALPDAIAEDELSTLEK